MSETIMITEPTSSRRGKWRRMFMVFFLLILLALGGFVGWALYPVHEVDATARTALNDSPTVSVTDRAWLAFIPQTTFPKTGVILYPGARVPAEAYAPLAHRLAEAGYLTVIGYPLLNLAIFNADLAQPIIEHFSAIDHWVLAGHSLGGVAAASFAHDHPDLVDGLIYIAAYPNDDTLQARDLAVMILYGTRDGLVSEAEIDRARDNLPDATFVEIIGANHAQFGYYGVQSGDQMASITHEQQTQQTVAAILQFLQQLD